MLQPAPAEQGFSWEDPLEYIEERRVVPIVGAELLTVRDAAGDEVSLQRRLAQKLEMKPTSLFPLVTVAFLVAGCGANQAGNNEPPPTGSPSVAKKADSATNVSAQESDLVGTWEMVGFVIDTNDNLQIDESERKDLKRTMKDFMKLNRDGSGTFTLAELPGRFETRHPENSGKRYLTWFDKSGSRHRVGTIIKVTKEELHIKEPGGHGLFIWRRL